VIDVSIVEPGFCKTGMSPENTSTAEQNDQSDAHGAFNRFMIEGMQLGWWFDGEAAG
jgi:hypothetical protein